MAEGFLPLVWSPASQASASGREMRSDLGSVAFLDWRAAERAADEWLDLARRVGEENPFLEPDFLLPALRYLDPRGRVRVAMIAGRGNRLAGLAPMVSRRLGHVLPGLALWTHEYGPLGTPLLDAVEGERAAASLLAAGEKRSIVFPHLPMKGAAARALRQAAEDAERPTEWFDVEARAMVDRLAPGPADLRHALPTRRRKELARQMRRLGELGKVTIEIVRDAPAVRNAFEEFLKLEAAGWKGRQGTALAADPQRLAFARDVVFRRSGLGGCHIAAIRLDGRPVAMLVSLLSTATVATWKIAYEEQLGRFSPGAQLMLEAAALFLAEPEVQRIDSLAAADHPMIDHLWHDRLAIGTLAVAPASGGPLYRAGLAASRLESRFRSLARSAKHALRHHSQQEKAA